MLFNRVGVIGAGQLAQMMVEPAARLNIEMKVFANLATDSAAKISPYYLGDYRKVEDLLEFAADCDVLTFEHELVPPDVLTFVESELKKVSIPCYPSTSTFRFSQDKLFMRKEFTAWGIPAPRWMRFPHENSGEIDFPLIAKIPTGGYDGRGVFEVHNSSALDDLYRANGRHQLLVEEKVDLLGEISLLIARSITGDVALWAPTFTRQQDSICIQTISPAHQCTSNQVEVAEGIARKIAEQINLVGVMAVEMFLTNQGVLVNEIALRPHNSGHWTIEGSATSQFEQHLRAVTGRPLGSTLMRAKWAVMGNLISGENEMGFSAFKEIADADLFIHDYQKSERKGRKVGHVTSIGQNLEEATSRVQSAVDSFHSSLIGPS
jgi:5-(carboxyamino)imidazole ribonucleotide synthase